MARPSNPSDLDKWQLRGHVIATIPSDHITKYPSLGQHLLAALAEADRLGLDRDGDDIVIPLTEAELDAKVKSAQRSWDYDKATYEAALAGEDIEGWRLSSMHNWCKAEGIEIPEVVA